MAEFHVFLSYARADDQPLAQGWVSAFHDYLLRRHQAYAGRPLKIFFDRQVIEDDTRWEREILSALRQSRLFIAFLSPNYLNSHYCRMELERYLSHEANLARGAEGIKQVYLVTIPELEDPGQPVPAPEYQEVMATLRARHHGEGVEFREFFGAGGEAALLRQLLELDAAGRLADLRASNGTAETARLLSLAERIEQLDRRIARRLDDASYADLADSHGSLPASYRNFVGRSAQLAELHEALVAQRIGIIGTLHGLGGQGKTAIAVQYGRAYAGFYACGGRWLIEAAGATRLSGLLARLPTRLIGSPPEIPGGISEAQQETWLVDAYIARLSAYTFGRHADVVQQRNQEIERHGPEMALEEHQPRLLLILDNADQPGLLASPALQAMGRYDWLELVVTTRLSPGELGDGREMHGIAIDDLPAADALDLLHAYRRFETADDRDAARGIVRELGGFTLAIDLVGAELQQAVEISYAGMLRRLQRDGATLTDSLQAAQEGNAAANLVAARARRIGLILEHSVASLPAAQQQPAWSLLFYAALFPGHAVVLPWLRSLVAMHHPEMASDSDEAVSPWRALLGAVDGRRLLVRYPEAPETLPQARLHDLVAAHLRAMDTMPAHAARIQALLDLAAQQAAAFEQGWLQQPAQFRPGFAPLFDLAQMLRRWRENDPMVARIIGQLSHALEVYRGLAAAIDALEGVLPVFIAQAEANPGSARAARDVSVSQERLGDYYLQRGAAGDAERALEHYQQSLATDEAILAANPGSADAARDVSVSQNKLGDYYLRRGAEGDAERALEHYQQSLATREVILVANPGSAQAARDVSVSQSKLGDYYLRRGAEGDAELALEHYQQSLTTREVILAANPGSAEAARDVSVLQIKLGDYYLQRGAEGDAERALEHYQQSLATDEVILAANPGSAQAARDVSVSQDRLGDYYLQRGAKGDAARALEHYQESLTTREVILVANPGSAQAARDVSVSQERLGDYYLRRGAAGDAERALEHYQQSRATSEVILVANPGSAQAARDVSVSQDRLGDYYLQRGAAGDAERALEHYQRSLATLEVILVANPGSAQAARDVSVSQNKLGDYYRQRGAAGDAARALEHYQQSLATSEVILVANPGSAQAARDVSVSQERLGDYYRQRGAAGDAARALEHYQQSLATREVILVANPGSADAARDVSVSQERLGDYYLRRGAEGDAERALEHYQQSLAIDEAILVANPGSAQAARDVSVSQSKLGDYYLRRGAEGDAELALEHYQQSLATSEAILVANPGSAAAGRDVVGALHRLGAAYGQIGNQQAAVDAWRRCHALLQEMQRRGMVMDAEMIAWLRQLREDFGDA